MTQYYFIFNQELCTECNSCVIACVQKNEEIDGQLRRVLPHPISISCNHCQEPLCQEVCPVNAINKRPQDGIVTVNSEECIGCKRCAKRCLYQAPYFSETKMKTYKCDLCLDRLNNKMLPKCVESCLMQAIELKQEVELSNKEKNLIANNSLPNSGVIKPNYILKKIEER
ncbi:MULTISPECIES: 4Fe-4S dicluster domain-containing protein [unclassified Candidatus Frackibacter]|uniref:4Fe-4S dicluster domain-containing protein n=1 Tax=unclassified Candidatus Frackibacter TaxID=2648818 RepID=UPI00088AC76F|nr:MULTISPECIES: 4Fe-4S dicluster domain-containing protein [unclassified Candidatus Frackibacter]SDC40799.1 anaerobic dimethyl sulfoxide reductase subunit B (DMSO reductase iron- sulfur subunit) [Candidatus Frackibacter sp. WG11]SEM60044.1 anaerobic dimethyl sulfoxide reductase subunit B (DMSO reductase iron- sulfur subunit) [Candidatus Frackibacter sp. WG12]SFL62004.1 anaerobic dimethyl sulfoxide reductase subunit B (DMSO reductase iron- sulfur subunit) [Candidatus Frackibacter sp. WG13]